MMKICSYMKNIIASVIACLCITAYSNAQTSVTRQYKEYGLYAGIEVGSKGVKLSVVELKKDPQKNANYVVLKDSSVNTDFISFTPNSFQSTLAGLTGLYRLTLNDLKLEPSRVFTVISSGVKIQAEKNQKMSWVNNLIDSFRLNIHEPGRRVEVVDVLQEARLSHLGIVPESRRYNTFLIDIGSGNTKGGYFPNGNPRDFRLFQLTWGTKSTANATEKRMEDDQTIENYNRQLYRVLAGSANDEIIYAVNCSGAYNMSDNIAFSGGIAWSVATLISPELMENPVIPVTFEEVQQFYDRLSANYHSLTAAEITRPITDPFISRELIAKEVDRVNKVFDQRSMLAGTALLLKIMRQFEGIYEKKQFYLVKNGQVGWISAYVDQHTASADDQLKTVNH